MLPGGAISGDSNLINEKNEKAQEQELCKNKSNLRLS